MRYIAIIFNTICQVSPVAVATRLLNQHLSAKLKVRLIRSHWHLTLLTTLQFLGGPCFVSYRGLLVVPILVFRNWFNTLMIFVPKLVLLVHWDTFCASFHHLEITCNAGFSYRSQW